LFSKRDLKIIAETIPIKSELNSIRFSYAEPPILCAKKIKALSNGGWACGYKRD
jgi:hypothetical protein